MAPTPSANRSPSHTRLKTDGAQRISVGYFEKKALAIRTSATALSQTTSINVVYDKQVFFDPSEP